MQSDAHAACAHGQANHRPRQGVTHMASNEYATVTAYLCVDGAAEAIEFYTKAFGDEERYRMPMDDGKVGHAEIRIGDTILMLSDEWSEGNVYSPTTLKGTAVSFVIDVE